MKASVALLLILIIFGIGFIAGSLVMKYYGGNIAHIAPSYALDSGCTDQDGVHRPCYTGEPKPFDSFWQEATKNTQFTKYGKPVEITDVQIFYKQDECKDLTINCCCPTACYMYYGNITYYPLGIDNAQTYRQ